MAQRELKTVEFKPNGVLDMDSGLRDIKAGNYINALDIEHLSSGTNGDEFCYNLNGNLLSFALPTIVRQNKKYRITITEPSAGTNTYGLAITNINGTPYSGLPVSTYTTTGSLATDTTAWATQLLTDFGGFGITTVPNNAAGTIDITYITTGASQGQDFLLIDTGAQKTNPIVLAEAISQNLAGQAFPVGGIDYLNDLFILSSSQTKAAQNIVISNVTNSGSFIVISVAQNLTGLLVNSDEVNISGVSGISIDINGRWLITNISYGATTTFDLISITGPFTGTYTPNTATLTLNPSGFLDISVNQFNVNTSAWTSTVLLQTKALSNRFINPLTGLVADRSNNILTLYFTDDVYVPRAWSYTGPYVANGSIEVLVPTGFYFYEGLNLSTNLFEQNATATIALNSVSNSGGSITSGNWKYAVRFKDSSSTPGFPSLLYGPVSIFIASTSTPNTVLGNTSGNPTSKAVSLQVNDIPLNTFAFLDLIGVQTVGDLEVGYLIKTVSIPTGVTNLQITHTGFETYVNFDIGLLDQQGAIYNTVETMAIVSNTLVIANLTQQQELDFTNWAQTFKHTIVKGTTQLKPVGDDVHGWTIGDYQDNNAIFNYIGYTDNETIRYGMCLELINGSRTPVFWVDDIRLDNFNTSGAIPFNRANPFGDNRRISSFASYDLSSLNPASPQNNNSYVTYVEFSGIDFTVSIDGQPISSFAKRLHIFRIDNYTYGLQEVLGCGIMNRYLVNSANQTDGYYVYGKTGNPPNPVATCIFDNPFLFTAFDFNLTGIFSGSPHPMSVLFGNGAGTYNPYSYGAWTGSVTPAITFTTFLSGCSFYCPDLIWGQQNIVLESGDAIVPYGQPDFRTTSAGVPCADFSAYDTFGSGTVCKSNFWSVFIKMSGAMGQATEPTYNTIAANAASTVSSLAGQVSFVPGFTYATGIEEVLNPTASPYQWDWDSYTHMIINCTTNILQNNANMWNGAPNGSPYAGSYDLGLYYMQYYRDKGSKTASSTGVSKFGPITTGTYIPTRCFVDITNNNNASINVFGGDTFTQKTFYKLRYPTSGEGSGASDPSGYATGHGVCVAFFCQNHFNFNMRSVYPDIPAAMEAFPVSLPGDWLNNSTANPDNSIYDASYTPQDNENAEIAFNSALLLSTVEITRIAWSSTNAQDSLVNNYRLFLPLNIYDLSPDAGPIKRIMNIQGELFSLQPKAFMREFYNETGSLNLGESGTNTEVILGSSAPMSKPPQLLSTNGCSNLFSIIEGKGVRGEDVISWVDITNRTIMMFSSSGGIHDIGLEKNIRSFLVNAMTWITGDNPSLRKGITGVFDEKRKEFIWTFMGWANIAAWNTGVYLTVGAYVAYGGNDINGVPIFYQNLVAGNTNHQPDISPTWWQLVPNTDTNVYSCFSLVYNLIKDGFTSFYTPRPYMYFAWTNTYISPFPNTTYNGIYQHDIGTPSTWYTHSAVSLTAQAFLNFVTNEAPGISKTFLALWADTLVVPYSMNFSTIENASYLLAADWEDVFDYFASPIKNDSIPTGLNTDDTSQCMGEYLSQTLQFQIGVTQKLYSIFTKYIINFRVPLK